MRKEKNVLVITRAFPPENSSSVHRPLKFTKFFPHFDWKPYVVTTKKNIEPIDHSLFTDIPKEASVIEVFTPEPGNLHAILEKKYRGKSKYFWIYCLLKAALKIYSILYYRIVIVDWHDGWIPFGFMAAKKILKKNDIDLIFLDMEPPSTSIIGILLKKIFNTPLVIDYHDPWTTSVYAKKRSGLKKLIAEKLEYKILSCANYVTAGKDLIISEIIGKFRDIQKDKLKTITSGYDSDDFKNIKIKKNKKFVITYTGKISEKFYYSPESFLYALGKLIEEKKILKNQIKVIFVGSISPQYQGRLQALIEINDLTDIIETVGSVRHRKCVEFQLNSTVLLYIVESIKGKKASFEFSNAIPSKIFEYIYTGNPILAIVPPGFESDLIKKTKSGYIAEPNNVNSVKNAILDLFIKYKNKNLQLNINASEIKKYDRKILTKKMVEIFNKTISNVN